MIKSSSIYTRVDPELKEQVERILSKLGLPMANAITLFLHQIIIHGGLPFELKLPQNRLPDYSVLTKEQFDNEMEKGLSDLNAGRIIPSSQVRKNMQRHKKA